VWGNVARQKVTIDNNDAENIVAEAQPRKSALMAELTWAKLYTKAIHQDLVAISTAVGKNQTTIAKPEMKETAEKLRDELQTANRTVGELSDHAGIRPVAAKVD
jgi:hypothetical protein